MRGDARSSGDDGHMQQDSSSGSSSPHSNISRSDEILEVNPEGYMGKPIYNFSIPDVIKHEPRVERHENNESLECRIPPNSSVRKRTRENLECRIPPNSSARKRTCENLECQIPPNSSVRNRTHENLECRIPSNSSVRKRACAPHRVHDEITQDDDVPLSVTNRKKRRRVTSAENLIDDDDDDCHLPPVIDLTDIDSHDEYSNAHSDSELNDSSHIETRPHHHTTSSARFNVVLSNLERYRQQLVESQVNRARTNRLHRLRSRYNISHAHAIITDGPLVTDDMLIQSPEAINISTPEMASADDSVMVINEVRGDSTVNIDDHAIALRMASDPTYSPPYHPPSNASDERSGVGRYSDESLNQFQERIRCIRQRSRDRIDQVRRMSYEAQIRLARIHDSINSLRHGRRPTENAEDPTEIDDENDDNQDRLEQVGDIDEAVNDEVEIIREANPQATTLDYLEPAINGLAHAPLLFHRTSNESANTARPFPDFVSIMNSFWGPLRPPRLHHLHEVPEGYEVLWNLAERLGPAKPRGLNKQEIDQIPSFRFSATTAKETNTKCVVCMGEYSNREKLRRLPCTHDFHSKCIDKWLRSNKTCPVCRDEVKIEANKSFAP